MDLEQALGLSDRPLNSEEERKRLQLYINLKLASSGQPTCQDQCGHEFLSVANDLLQSYRQKSRLLSNYLCPADTRIQTFIDDYLADVSQDYAPKLPTNTLVLDRHGVARELSIPPQDNTFTSEYVKSFRVNQGVLHNTIRDRRTTKGSFHIAEGGLPVPGDKKSVPKAAFAHMLYEALNPPTQLTTLPFTSNQTKQARMFVSLLLRPTVCPEVPGFETEKSMEIRFFAPGELVSNLDFVESIFGNAGNPYLTHQDAGLDIHHWTGHTGCVILAPQIIELTKQELGLPHYDDATERQRHDEMCWKEADERYNGGQPFKVTCRDKRGVIVTILADNYFGYCKKEVKTQLSYAANLYGLVEEEHAGGALAFPRYNHGEEFGTDSRTRNTTYRFQDVLDKYGESMTLQAEGYAIDKRYPQLIYVPEDLRMDLNKQTVTWRTDGQTQSIPLQPGKVYMHPSGYKVSMEKHPSAPTWRLVGTEAEGTFCHKPCTVSGGGKSEISKAIDDAMIYGPLFVNDYESTLDQVEQIFKRDYSTRYKAEFQIDYSRRPSRQPLSSNRSLGSVIKLLTPSDEKFTPEYNTWLRSISDSVRAVAFIIKRFYRQEWKDNWRKQFSVNIVDGSPGHELMHKDRPLSVSYLRVGFDESQAWRTYKMRQDYVAAEKVQMEDDITASIVVPIEKLSNKPERNTYPSVKLVKNCEYRLFQRPDDAIIKGFDKQAEREMSQPGSFLANYQPLDTQAVSAIIRDLVEFDKFTPCMRDFLENSANTDDSYTVCSANPLMVDGKPSKNPRYLQLRADLANPFKCYLAVAGARFHRGAPLQDKINFPVDAVLTGRRNNPPEKAAGIRSLAVYNPIHYQALPELFMDFICSLTGKSPSTTGAGTEGALTKGPFNAVYPTADLNNALVSFILTDYPGFSSAAGYVGPKTRVNHDISLLVPEIWARIKPEHRTPQYLIDNDNLEALEDFEHNGQTVLASRLGYRITARFVHNFFGKIFDSPTAVFDNSILRPETQDMEAFVDGINNIVEAQQRVAQCYLTDGSIEEACPPLKALLHIMAEGTYEGKSAHHADIRAMFTRDYLLASDWYRQRLETKQTRDKALWQRHIDYLGEFLARDSHQDEAERLNISARLQEAKDKLTDVSQNTYPDSLIGTLGADPMGPITA